MARHADLEAKLIENPADDEARLVYADFLQREGDPRGELISLQHRAARDEADAFFAAHADAFIGPLAKFTRTWDHDPIDAFEWHLGFIRRAIIGFESHTDRPDDGDPDELDDLDQSEVHADKALAALLAHPSSLLLEELTVRSNMIDDGMYFDPVLRTIATHGAPALRALRLGEFRQAGPGSAESTYDYENSWAGFGDGSAVWARVPRLERLRIQLNFSGGSQQNITDKIGEFDLPALRHVEIITGGMSSACLRSFAAGHLPRLEHMDLWTGSANYGGDGAPEDLAPLLAGDRVPSLRHLGIMNCEFTDDVIELLARSQLLPRLRELNLAYGKMTDAGAAALAKHADAFAHLEVLDLSENYIRDVSRVLGICKSVLHDQRAWDDDYRYVALGE